MTTLSAAQLLEQNQSLMAMLHLHEATITQQQAQLIERDAKLVLRTGEVLHLTTWIEKLKLQIAVLKNGKFGRSSEKLDQEITQLELIVDELEAEQGAHAQMGVPVAAADE